MIAITPPILEIPAPVISIKMSEDALVSGLQKRSEQQFKMLYGMYAPALLGIISRIVKSDVVAEDVLQESFVKIWNGIDGYDVSRGRLFTWMASTARHTAIDQLRSKAALNAARNSNMDDLTQELEIQRRTEINPDAIGVKQLTGHLPVAEKEILELIYFQGFTHSEVAKKLNIPLGTVKTRVRKAVSSLRCYFS